VSDRWHIAACDSPGRATIRDQNGLFVAEVVASDAELVAAAPALLAFVAEVLADPLVAILDDLSEPEALVARLKGVAARVAT